MLTGAQDRSSEDRGVWIEWMEDRWLTKYEECESLGWLKYTLVGSPPEPERLRPLLCLSLVWLMSGST